MKYRILFAVLLVFPLAFGTACSDDSKPAKPAAPSPPVESSPCPECKDKLDPTVIAEHCKRSVVAIENHLTREDGSEATYGGTGFFIDKQAHVGTCGHVVWDDATEEHTNFGVMKVPRVTRYEYWVTLGARKYKAELVSVNKYKDVAVLKVLDIDPDVYDCVTLGDSDKTKQGEDVYAFGNPLDLDNSFTEGNVSAVHRHVETDPTDDIWSVQDFIQTTAPINPGNSGGPLFNSHGEVVGINAGTYPGYDGLHLAISINFANFPKLMTSGVVQMGYLGADIMPDNFARTGAPGHPGMRDLFHLNQLTGIDDVESIILLANMTYPMGDDLENRAIVLGVDAKSPAETAKLKRGDLVTSFNGHAVKSGRDVRLLMLDTETGKEIEVKLLRIDKGAVQELTVKVTLLKEKPKSP